MKKEDLLKILEEDELGLLADTSNKSQAISADERMIASFKEINEFIKENDREPIAGKGVQEHKLATRLKSIRSDQEKSNALADYDQFNLLEVIEEETNSVEDILKSDDFNILDNEDEELFEIKNVPLQKNRKSADYIGRRKPCRDFSKYEELFQQCQKDLASGKRKLLKFTSEKQVEASRFFVLNGILLFVEKVGDIHVNKYGKLNGRQICIFENGTESDMLFRSLVQRLYENGHAVSETKYADEKEFLENFNVITEIDDKTGFIYILRSKSEDQKIQSIDNLYKIGFSTTPVEDRIKNTEEDPTYLMGPVKIISTFECYNLNPQKFEQLIHNFFGTACLNLDIYDKNGQRHTPREWFIVPLPEIEKAISLIINRGIINYRYDAENKKIVLK